MSAIVIIEDIVREAQEASRAAGERLCVAEAEVIRAAKLFGQRKGVVAGGAATGWMHTAAKELVEATRAHNVALKLSAAANDNLRRSREADRWVTFRCPHCLKTTRALRHESDLPGTVTMEMACPKCAGQAPGGGEVTQILYFDADGKQLHDEAPSDSPVQG